MPPNPTPFTDRAPRDVSAWAMLFDPMLAIETKDDGRLTLADLPDHIDYVVLSHAHQDHFNPEMLLLLF